MRCVISVVLDSGAGSLARYSSPFQLTALPLIVVAMLATMAFSSTSGALTRWQDQREGESSR